MKATGPSSSAPTTADVTNDAPIAIQSTETMQHSLSFQAMPDTSLTSQVTYYIYFMF